MLSMNQANDVDVMMDKARESLASAEADLAARRFNSCANRAYFACFQAALSVMIHQGMASANSTIAHQTVATQFAEQLVRRRKLFPARITGELYDLMVWRHQADYQTAPISSRRTREAVRRASQFLEIVLQ